ncbi:MAG: carbon-nitrogen hydrolase family protein [Anaerolineae bacterium]|nr:carbon-nitrogen hydrolase family protein [Anaerolineae bacterium]
MTRKVTISSVQLPNFREGTTNAEKRESNIRTAEEMLLEAGQRGSDIACLGEMFNILGCEVGKENLRQEVDPKVPGDVVERLGRLARRYRMYVIAPIYGLVNGVPRNIAQLIGRDGGYLGGYCKVHPTDGELKKGIVAGDDWPVWELDFGKIGMQICHDASFPESARCLMLNGAEVIFWPHVMGAWGDITWDAMLRLRAYDNGVWHVASCFGVEPNRAWRPGMMQGRSSIVAPDGIILADAGRYPGIATATVDLDRPRIAHSFTLQGEYDFRTDVLNNRRPDTYGPLVKPRKRVPPAAPPGPRPWLSDEELNG